MLSPKQLKALQYLHSRDSKRIKRVSPKKKEHKDAMMSAVRQIMTRKQN